MKNKKKGYVLAVVMLFSLLLATVLVTTFAVCYRYQRLAKRNLEELRQEVFVPAETQQSEGGDPIEGDSTEDDGEIQTPDPAASSRQNFNGVILLGETLPNARFFATPNTSKTSYNMACENSFDIALDNASSASFLAIDLSIALENATSTCRCTLQCGFERQG